MKVAWVLSLALGLLSGGSSAFAVDGTFRGKVVDTPASETAVSGWIYVQGRNHMLRRVEVAHAAIVFGEDIPVSQQRKCNSECLRAGQEVRITAHQDTSGEWRAKQVEILKITYSNSRNTPENSRFTKLYPFLSILEDNQSGRIWHRISYGAI
ncbi:MAG TPA: hypothetical protein VH724_17395 [Candidatus Angelobacter sp.]|nr:hypothetical protein [Candidatus Angelobacter sp.]